jgi:hypothetical protein
VEPQPLAPGARTHAAAFGVAALLDDLLVVGYHEFALANVNQKQRDGWIARYDGEGTARWEAHVGTAAASDELAAVEISGPSLFVSGTLNGNAQLLKVAGNSGAVEQVPVNLPNQRFHDHALLLGADAVLVGEQAGHAVAGPLDQDSCSDRRAAAHGSSLDPILWNQGTPRPAQGVQAPAQCLS